jgi:hypothetical protein
LKGSTAFQRQGLSCFTLQVLALPWHNLARAVGFPVQSGLNYYGSAFKCCFQILVSLPGKYSGKVKAVKKAECLNIQLLYHICEL